MAFNITWLDRTDLKTPLNATYVAFASIYNTLKAWIVSPVQKITDAFVDTDIIIDGTKEYSTTKVIAGATHTITASDDDAIADTLSAEHKQGNELRVRYKFDVDCTITLTNFESTGNNTGTITPIPAGSYNLKFQANARGVNLVIPQNIAANKLDLLTTDPQTVAGNYASVGKTLSFTATPTFDFNDGGNVQKMEVTGDITSLSILNELPSGIYTIFLNQDSTGGHSIAMPGSSFGAITKVSQSEYSLNPNAMNSINIQVDPNGNKMYWINATVSEWFVRPSGGSYGAENGTSYADAWSGFSNINWGQSGVQQGSTLYVAGTHLETLTVGASGILGNPINISGNYSEDLGIIDGEDFRGICINISSKNYININTITLIDTFRSNLNIEGTSTGIITNNITAYGSGNQAIQHLGSVSATHNNPTCYDNIDDGISSHDDCTVVINYGNLYDNKEGVNWVGGSVVTINGTTFSNNSLYDVNCNASTGSGVINDVDFDGEVAFTDGALLEINNCTNVDLFSINGDFTANDTVFTSIPPPLSASVMTLNGCIIPSIVFNTNGDYYISKCNFLSMSVVVGTMDIRIDQSLINVGANHGLDITSSGGVTEITNSVFKGMASGKFGLVARAGSSNVVNNGNTYDGGDVGSGYFNGITQTINNNVFIDCNLGISGPTGTCTANNCCFFSNATDTSGTVTLVNDVTGDPNFVDTANDDYTLGAGSSCIGTGLDLGTTYENGIHEADWGDANTAPVVTTKTQVGSWDIGAYIS